MSWWWCPSTGSAVSEGQQTPGPQIVSSLNESLFLPRLVQVQFPVVATKRFLTSLEAHCLPGPDSHSRPWQPVEIWSQAPSRHITHLPWALQTALPSPHWPSVYSSISSPPHPSRSHPKCPLSSLNRKCSLLLSLSHHTGYRLMLALPLRHRPRVPQGWEVHLLPPRPQLPQHQALSLAQNSPWRGSCRVECCGWGTSIVVSRSGRLSKANVAKVVQGGLKPCDWVRVPKMGGWTHRLH